MNQIKQEERERRSDKIRNYADERGRWFKDVIRETVEEAGTITAAADVIGVNRVSLQRFLTKHNIQVSLIRKAGGNHGN
jgi:ActR/RegA family two-component response regulator